MTEVGARVVQSHRDQRPNLEGQKVGHFQPEIL